MGSGVFDPSCGYFFWPFKSVVAVNFDILEALYGEKIKTGHS